MKTFFQSLIEDIIVTTKNNLGISRNNMPQIKEKHIPAFLKFIEKQGIKITKMKIQVNKLKPTQKEINLDRVRQKLKSTKKKIIIISRDNQLLDGHHLWMALRIKDPFDIVTVFRINLPMYDLLKRARNFDKVTYKDINSKPIKR